MINDIENIIDSNFAKHLLEVEEFKKSISQETDRGCALMVASLLDKKIEDLLKANFVDDSKSTKAILNVSGAISSFSSKIDISYLMGLIGTKVKRDLHLIRKIRNIFGHELKPVFFNDSEITNRCFELFHGSIISQDAREVFINTSLQIFTLLQVDIHKSRHADYGRDLYENEEDREKGKEFRQEIRNMISKIPKDQQKAVANELKRIILQKLEP